MPEGDSIRRLASRLEPVLVGRAVTAFSARRIPDDSARALVGQPIVGVDSRGKNLIVRFEGGTALHIHLRMNGRIAIERPRSAFWTAPRTAPDLRLAVTGGAIVGHRLPVCRLVSSSRLRAELARLGPDLAREGAPEDEALPRLRSLGLREVGDALMVQSAVAGIGNVYKSEVLFLESVDPRTPVSRLDDARLRAVVRRAGVLLRANSVGAGPRTTRRSLSGPRLWVYGREGRPCLRCGAAIVRYRQGAPPGRSTYACPVCQR